MRIARSFNCGFDAIKIRQPRRSGRIFRNGFVCRPCGALFFGGVDPQLKLRAYFRMLLRSEEGWTGTGWQNKVKAEKQDWTLGFNAIHYPGINMRRLDSRFSTLSNKWLAYIFLAFMWGITIKTYAEGNHRVDVLHYILPPVSVLILWWFSTFKQVTLDGDTLVIRGFRREARVPVSLIERIGKHRGFRDPDFITIVFKTKTEFGRRVRIMTGISSGRGVDQIAKMLQRAMSGKDIGVKIIQAPREPATISNPADGKEVVVRGWTNEELSGILTDFADMSDGDLETLITRSMHATMAVSASLFLVLPHDIRILQFSFLVNYLQYPKNYDLKARSISVIGKATLTPDFHLPEKNLIGQKAVFYIPSNDQDYDLTYVRVGDETFKNSFAARHWTKVEDSRIPHGVEIKQ